MSIIFRCPECNKKLKAPPALAGMDTNCPACTSEIAIPFESREEEARRDAGEEDGAVT